MALSKEAKTLLKTRFKLAKKKTLRFYYCQEGANGDPVLAIEKQINPEKKRIRAEAAKKVFVEGELRSAGKEMFFITKTPNKGKFAVNLKRFFGKQVPEIKKAHVLSPEDFEAQGQTDAASPTQPGVEDARAEDGDPLQPAFESGPRQMSDADLKTLGNAMIARLESGEDALADLVKKIKKEARLRKQIRSAAKALHQSHKSYKELATSGTDALKKATGEPDQVIAQWRDHIAALTEAQSTLARRGDDLREALDAQA